MNTHDVYLEELVNNLEAIGEDRLNMKFILKDVIWMPDNSYCYNRLCDLICGYHDGHAVPIELKASKIKRAYAKLQLKAGCDFIKQVLGMDVRYGIFVVYSSHKFEYERIMS